MEHSVECPHCGKPLNKSNLGNSTTLLRWLEGHYKATEKRRKMIVADMDRYMKNAEVEGSRMFRKQTQLARTTAACMKWKGWVDWVVEARKLERETRKVGDV